MSLISIVQYETLWSLGADIGQIRIQTEANSDWILLPIETVEEFTAVSYMLSQPPVLFDTVNENIVLPPRSA